VPETNTTHAEPVSSEHDDHPIAVSEQNTSPAETGSRICGIRKKTFFIALAAILFVVAAVVGGVTGGVLGTRGGNSSVRTSSSFLIAYQLMSQNQGSSDEQGTPTHSPPSPTASSSSIPSDTGGGNTTSASPTPTRQMKAWRTREAIFTAWQAASGDLYLQGYNPPVQTWGAPLRMDLTYPAVNNTPLALCFWNLGGIFVRL
jgi:hypothetical protein